MQFDLLIKGGEVVDPGGGKQGRLDVAIKRNHIAAVDSNIPAESAVRVVARLG
jgi:dihydroorotase